MANNVTLPAAFSTDPDIFQDELIAYIEAMDIHDLDVTNFASTIGVITVGSSSPGTTDGMLWWDTNQVTNGPSRHLKVYNSAIAGFQGAPALYVPTSSLPTGSSATPGMLAYDTTLQILRVYRTATQDALITGGAGITGWHPLSPGFVLYNAGVTLTAGDIVRTDISGERKVRLPAGEREQAIKGVAVEAAASGATVVVAVLGGGQQVVVKAVGTTHEVSLGDLLVANAASSGVARSVGPQQNSPFSTGPFDSGIRYGTPIGAFATAQSALTTGTATVTAVLSSFVGQGAHVRIAAATMTSSATVNGYVQKDATASLILSKHSPIAAAMVSMKVAITSGSGDDPVNASVAVSADAVDDNFLLEMDGRTNGQNIARFDGYQIVVPTNDTGGVGGTPAAMGNKFSYLASLTIGSSMVVEPFLTGYIY